MRRFLVWLICFFPLPLHAGQRDNFSAWFVDSLVKVFPDSPAAISRVEPALASARNGHCSLQVALRSESRRAIRVLVSAPPFKQAALRVRTFLVRHVNGDSHPPNTPFSFVVPSVLCTYR